jgi:hypothetical protein
MNLDDRNSNLWIDSHCTLKKRKEILFLNRFHDHLTIVPCPAAHSTLPKCILNQTAFSTILLTTPSLPFSMPPQTDTIVPGHTPDIPSAKAYPVPSTSLLAIEHPAILSSVEAGLRTLGGQHAIAKVPPWLAGALGTKVDGRLLRITRMRRWNYGTGLRTGINIPSFHSDRRRATSSFKYRKVNNMATSRIFKLLAWWTQSCDSGAFPSHCKAKGQTWQTYIIILYRIRNSRINSKRHSLI